MKNVLQFKKLSTKIILGFVFVIVMAASVSTYYHYSTKSINNKTMNIIEEQIPLLESINRILLEINTSTSYVHAYFIDGFDQQLIKEQYKQLTEYNKEVEAGLRESVENAAEIDRLLAQKQQWHANLEKAMDTYDTGDRDMALRLIKEADSQAQNMERAFQEMALTEVAAIDKSGQQVKGLQAQTNIVNSIMSTLILIGGISVALITARSITKPIMLVMNRMEGLAQGDLSLEPLVVQGKDEVASLIHAANVMTENNRELLNRLVAVSSTVSEHSEKLMQSAVEVKSGTGQVAVTMEELAKGAESQATGASDLATMMGTFTIKMDETNKNGE